MKAGGILRRNLHHQEDSQRRKATKKIGQTSCLEEAGTSRDAWDGFRSTEAPGKGTLQSVELPRNCTVCSTFPAL